MGTDASGVLMMAVYFAGCALPTLGRSVKRVADGEPLSSPHDYSTYYFVHLREAYGCIVNQATHQLGNCQEINSCGGTLIHPEFVITAQHCVSYYEFALRSFKQIYNISILDTPGVSLQELGFFYNAANNDTVVIPNKPQSKHGFYSNIVLLAGSTHYFGMTQKRHAHKVFSHPIYHHKVVFSLIEHDVAIIQACEPFQITSTVKTPTVKPMEMLQTQWESIIKRSTTCLFMGFGVTDDESTGVYHIMNPNVWVNTEYMRITWRQMRCPEKCREEYDTDEAHEGACIGCAEHIPPRYGTAREGDSGGPVVCDGFYVGVFLGGIYQPAKNETQNWMYALHCMKKAFTPQAFDFYRKVTIKNGQFNPLFLDMNSGEEESGAL